MLQVQKLTQLRLRTTLQFRQALKMNQLNVISAP